MINLINNQFLSVEERKAIFQRAAFTNPFFATLHFPLVTGAGKINQYASKVPINRDFYLTEIISNFGEIFTETASLFNVSVYSQYSKSVWRYANSLKIPSGFVSTEARFRTTIPNQIFDDRQFENLPFYVRRNDELVGEIENIDAKGANADAVICLKGFNINENFYLDNKELQDINNSVNKPVRYEYFFVRVDQENRSVHVIKNDNFPRLILGLGVTNSTADKSRVSNATIKITDNYRKLTWNDKALPIQFIAPRMTCLADEHIYYLPTEYYFQPQGQLQFDIDNVSPDQDNLTGFDLAILTRTV